MLKPRPGDGALRAQLDRVRLDLALRSAQLIVWVWDMATDMFEMRAEDRAYAGLAQDHVLAAQTFAMMHPDDVAPSIGYVERTRLGEPHVPIEFRLPDGTGGWRWWVGRASRFGEGEQPFIVGVCYDDTQRRAQESALERSEREARQAADAKANFVAMMSHEIRTPMNGVIGMLELLGHTGLDDAQRRMLDTCRDSAQQLMALLNDVLDFSKIEAGRLELDVAPLSPHALVEHVAAAIVAQAGQRDIAVEAIVADDVPARVLADRVRLRQVLANLAGNAVKFTRQGKVAVALSRAPEEDDSGRAWLRFDIVDTGIGIAPDVLPTLFQPFRQADASTTRRFGGTGLGLSIVRHLVDAMGGRVDCESEAGKGSRFTVVIPAEACESEAATPSTHSPSGGIRREAPDGGKPPPTLSRDTAARMHRLLLLADDHPVNREVIAQQLQHLGYACDAVEDGEAAWTRLQVHRDNYLLVLTDCHMPRLDGFALTRCIRDDERRRDAPPLPIVAFTASATSDDDHRCRNAGMDDVIAKPVQLDALRAMFDRVHPPLAGLPAIAALVHEDTRTVQRILDTFARDARDDLVRWREATARGDRDALRMLAHRFASGCRHVAAHDAARVFEVVEQDAPDPRVADDTLAGGVAAAGACMEALLRHVGLRHGLSSPA